MLSLMQGVVLERNSRGERYTGAMFSAELGKDWTEAFKTFVQFTAPHIAHARDGGNQASLDVGMTYLLSRSWQLEAKLLKGLNQRTPALTGVFGIAARN